MVVEEALALDYDLFLPFLHCTALRVLLNAHAHVTLAVLSRGNYTLVCRESQNEFMHVCTDTIFDHLGGL